MERIFLIRASCQDRSAYPHGGNGEAHLFYAKQVKDRTDSGLSQRKRSLAVRDEPKKHPPGNRNAAVATGDDAVLLLRVNHGGINCQGRTGVDYRAGSVGKQKECGPQSSDN